MPKSSIALLISAVFGLSACQPMPTNGGFQIAPETKQAIATVTGAVVGGVLGSRVGGGNGRVAATILGTIGGAALGNYLGKMFTQSEQAEVAYRSNDALYSRNDGQSVSWRNPETGATAKITPSNTRQEVKTVTVYRNKNVAQMPQLDLIGEPYQSLKSAKVRLSPTTQSEVVGGLGEGESFTAVGKVRNKPWIVVAQDGRTVGFVYSKLVGKASPTVAKMERSRVAEQKPPVDLDSMGLVADEVQVATVCRDLSIDAKKGSAAQSQQFTACKSGSGTWEIS